MDRKKYQQAYYRNVVAPARSKTRTTAGLHISAKCVYCGNRATELDHVVPRCNGGEQTVAACLPCNRSKGARPLEQWRMQLSRNKSGCPYFSPSQREYLLKNGIDVDATLMTVRFYFEGGDDDVSALVSMGATRMR